MGLGALRFCLSLMVIDVHYGFVGHRIQVATTNHFGLDRLAYVGAGGIAVNGFFVISGYLITLVLARKYDAGWRGANPFYVSRALRIYPLYWLVLAAYWAALTWLGAVPARSAADVAGNLSLVPYGVVGMAADQTASGLLTSVNPLLIGPAWTLAYDLLFYLLAPWLFVNVRTCWWVAALGFMHFAAFVVFADPRPPVWFQFFYGAGMPYLFMFSCGALAYHYRTRLRPGWGAAAALVAGLVWVTYFPLGMPNAFLNSLVTVLLLTPLVAILGHEASRPGVDRALGDLTYATYLIHLPLLTLAQHMALPHAAPLAFALTYLVSAALLVGFEYPLDRLRDQLHAKSDQRRPGTATEGAAGAIPVVLILLIGGAAIVSLWNNLLRAGDDIELRATACPKTWHCDAGTVTLDGAGRVTLTPTIPAVNRAVIEIHVPPGPGKVQVGLASQSGTFRVELKRVGEACHLQWTDGRKIEGDPLGWSSECRAHRLVFSRAAGQLLVIVDSLWVLGPVTAPEELHAVVTGEEGSGGTSSVRNLFVTRG